MKIYINCFLVLSSWCFPLIVGAAGLAYDDSEYRKDLGYNALFSRDVQKVLPDVSGGVPLGKNNIVVWLWKLEEDIKNQQAIEQRIADTYGHRDLGFNVSYKWVGAEDDYWSHFKDRVKRRADVHQQLIEFKSYIQDYYLLANNHFHVLVATGEWEGNIIGKGQLFSHFLVASNAYDSVVAHELGHNFGATHEHSGDTAKKSIMVDTLSTFSSIESRFLSLKNRNIIARQYIEATTKFPSHTSEFLHIRSLDVAETVLAGNTSQAPSSIAWQGKAAEHAYSQYYYLNPRNLTRQDHHTFEILKADFDAKMYLLDNNGHLLAQSGEDLKKYRKMVVDLRITDPVYLVVTGGGRSAGEYRIAIRSRTRKVSKEIPKLAIKYTTAYRQVWNNRGLDVEKSGDIYAPVEHEGYFPLGHYVVLGNHADRIGSNGESVKAILVKDTKGITAKPVDYFQSRSMNKGSKGSMIVWRPIAPKDHTCFGDVAFDGGVYGNKPSRDLIRCVHNKYVIRGSDEVSRIWCDKVLGGEVHIGLLQKKDGVYPMRVISINQPFSPLLFQTLRLSLLKREDG